jgi:regulator of sirC expression with transglutaminase-like and TPR domain
MSALLEALAAQPPVIEDVALAIAADEYPHLDRARYRHALDDIAATVRARDGGGARLAVMVRHLYAELGFHGNETDYYDPRNSYLNDVIDRRTGIPISLAVVLMAVARRLDLQMEGIGFPGHFLVRFGGPGGAFLDPFHEGRVLGRAELERLAARHLERSGASFEGEELERHLEPVGAHAIAVRMLGNLKHVHEQRGDHARALVVCDRLFDLSGAVFFRRDRGLHALALGAHRSAEGDLEAYLHEQPNAPDAPNVRPLLERARAGARRQSLS